MSKRLQVVLDDAEWREIQRAARAQRLTVAAWVRAVLRAARRREPLGDSARKLDHIRTAARHAFPTADIDRMQAEIERGYLGGAPRDLR
ncbi:MAG: antitoxin [Candidatus Rokubacteria bacterium]|nr:antitoxin [Candidatus Rokubacteria bacterium]